MITFKKIRLQTKILGLISALILIIITLLASIFAYLQAVDSRKQVEQSAIQASRSISLMPELKEAIKEDNLEIIFRPIAGQVKDQVNAANIIIENREKIIYSHTNPNEVGNNRFDHSSNQVLIFGGSNTFESEQENGTMIVGKVPIMAKFEDYNRVIGTVSVEFLEKDIYESIFNRIKTIMRASTVVFFLGFMGSIFLTKSIRKDTLGLEPHEISALYRERNAILLSIKEGIIAIDQKGCLTLINHSAISMLELYDDILLGQRIDHVMPDSKILEVLKTGKSFHNAAIQMNEKMLILNVIPIMKNDQVIGAVSSFRDKTELKSLIDTLSEVQEYSGGLRAQTHEYTNKLYLSSGLLQLERYQDAFEFIQKESTIHQHRNQIIFNQIHDKNVQAILLGKLGKASEKKITLEIDPHSNVEPLPSYIEITDIMTIIGNLIDNAFDAVADQKEKRVSFSITSFGNDNIIEVIDNGKGIPKELIGSLFSKGASSKGENRGYGLFNVKRIVEDLGGTIDVQNSNYGGAIFTVYLPKKVLELGENQND